MRGGLPLLALTAVLGLSACANANPGASEINDPLEPMNRKVHAFNKGADRVAVRPAAKVYGTVVPKPIRTGISNFAWNLGMPSAILNSLLEGDVQGAGKNSFRFLVNTTFGLGGVLDPATDMGLTEQEADFGETLHDWGMSEGPYVELPLLGPSTARDAVGKVVDYITDPVNSAFQSPEKQYVTGTKGLSLIGERYTYMGTVDSLLYDSADSYAQARLLYLQNRRFELGSDTEVDTYDPYEDSDGQ